MGMNSEAMPAERELAARRELFAVLAHEFRSPIGAILGFEELLSEGIFGDVPDAARDALARIRSSAHQLLDLVAGLNDLSGGRGDEIPLQRSTADMAALITGVVASVTQEAAGRATVVEVSLAADLPTLETDPERIQRAIRLALMAAIKSSAGQTVRLAASPRAGGLLVEVTGTGLEPQRDEPDLSLNAPDRPQLTAGGLRIAMARDALAPLHGEVLLVPGPDSITVRILLPPLPSPGRD